MGQNFLQKLDSGFFLGQVFFFEEAFLNNVFSLQDMNCNVLLPYWLAGLCPTTVVSWKLDPSKQARMLIKAGSRREVDLLGGLEQRKRR